MLIKLPRTSLAASEGKSAFCFVGVFSPTEPPSRAVAVDVEDDIIDAVSELASVLLLDIVLLALDVDPADGSTGAASTGGGGVDEKSSCRSFVLWTVSLSPRAEVCGE